MILIGNWTVMKAPRLSFCFKWNGLKTKPGMLFSERNFRLIMRLGLVEVYWHRPESQPLKFYKEMGND